MIAYNILAYYLFILMSGLPPLPPSNKPSRFYLTNAAYTSKYLNIKTLLSWINYNYKLK